MSTSSQAPTTRVTQSADWASRTLRWSGAGLVFASWISAGIFGLYILAFYLGALAEGRLSAWNENLPGLYQEGNTTALIAMAAHLVTGAVILLLGPIQLIDTLRRRMPSLHRWFGRIYVLTAGVAGLGGLGFIIGKGTIGGPVMDVGFGLYGVLMVLAAFKTYSHARNRRFHIHRAWAVRLFALAIGSWLYRMDYGFWFIIAHRAGHTSDFRGPFDIIMSFFFYVPNLIVAEMFIRSQQMPSHTIFKASAALLLNFATLMVAIGSYYFTRYYWGPSIIGRWAAITG